jgi:hypothetical protein|tara:strand:- start:4405 stop:4620 length:216 start_codon:yes stop_codon:yes gene_type:complete
MIINPKAFSLKIENMVKEKQLTHMEAVLLYCDEKGLDPATVKPLISKTLKDKIEVNARDLHFLSKRAQLPI